MSAVSHPVFARCYAWLSRKMEPEIGAHRDELLHGLHGVVVEVGAGNGLNFAHYPDSVRQVVAIEPEPSLRAMAVRAASRASVDVRVIDGTAEALPLADASADAAVFSLVLCSVHDPARALAEARRVLRSGGELRVYEHVRGAGACARWQRTVDHAWPLFAGGCHTNRDTVAAIEAAGFSDLTFRRFFVPEGSSRWNPVAPHVLGRARRG